jgi:DNA-directed RNA polymerase subunit RPC12/RpoP
MRSAYCDNCGRKVLTVYRWPNFFLHAVLLVATCGLYAPVWLWAMFRQVYLCSRCGSRV